MAIEGQTENFQILKFRQLFMKALVALTGMMELLLLQHIEFIVQAIENDNMVIEAGKEELGRVYV